MKRTIKNQYYTDLLNQYSSDIKKTWNVLNLVTGRTKNSDRPSTSFSMNNEPTTNPNKIAKGFCEYFTGVGNSLLLKYLTLPSHSIIT